ncbi:MAG: indolepyruvate oxidoreductase subunit beta family protein [Burkholderiaceae bacterium]|nr:indolepyruvate oxidoreductase subunit beta family protein [Burkholderiaceae bacterium]
MRPLNIAILAMGGEGGGVLADWIVDLAEHNGYIAQATSVAGVAQRTGATIYYVEMFPRARAERDGAEPLLALMPAPGDVDIVVASELMEAARAVQRGLVTPDRTTLIASTHRVLSIHEKSAMGEGARDAARMEQACASAARRFVRFDMAETVERIGSVISAVLFGALSGEGALPFDRQQFEDTIRRGGVGVESSLRAFAEGFERAKAPSEPLRRAPAPAVAALPQTHADPRVARLLVRLRDEFGDAVRPTATEGVRRLLDYQDPEYAASYLDRLARLAPHGDDRLLEAVARHLALWMSYEDTIRVADLKTRSKRFERVRAEVRPGGDTVLSIDEFMHPRLEEIADTVPAPMGRWLLKAGPARRLVERLTTKGRIVPTTSLGGFLMLRTIAAMRRWRRSTLRYGRENAQIEQWLDRIDRVAPADPALAVEIARCQRLVKGYGDTHERGSRNFATLMACSERLEGRENAASALRELHEAALADDAGNLLRERVNALH